MAALFYFNCQIDSNQEDFPDGLFFDKAKEKIENKKRKEK